MSDETDANYAERDDLVLLVALHSLSPAEQAAAEAEIDADPRRRAELDAVREVLARLADAEATVPPPAMRQRVLGLIDHVDQDEVSPSPPTSLAARRRRPRLLEWSAAAAVAALVAGAVAWFALGRDTGDSDEIAAVLDDPSAETATLTGDLGEIELVYLPDADEAVIVADGVADPGSDRAYQLWFIEGDTPQPSAVFRPDDDGQVEVLVDGFNGGDSNYAVTEEPAGGSEAPTGDIIATTG